MIPLPPRSTLFPYTTLCRSQVRSLLRGIGVATGHGPAALLREVDQAMRTLQMETIATRSEEHTSELQSRQYPVCRLVLAKKPTAGWQLRSHGAMTSCGRLHR